MIRWEGGDSTGNILSKDYGGDSGNHFHFSRKVKVNFWGFQETGERSGGRPNLLIKGKNGLIKKDGKPPYLSKQIGRDALWEGTHWGGGGYCGKEKNGPSAQRGVGGKRLLFIGKGRRAEKAEKGGRGMKKGGISINREREGIFLRRRKRGVA